ncbi:4553_t:CDS:2 [Funneliformis geosporum]|uniref:4553_t:CDS:1 n=1 Tax=Funneliformis geosporum TaxID=1117311 RepID=A0A9W4SEF6_9GLOM|nr:4553_t:CDS:2 [Funneliformis geosporum]
MGLTHIATTSIEVSYEATKSICSLASATYPLKSQIKIVPEKLVEGKTVVEILTMGFTQATVQMKSSLSRKHKANEIDDEYDMDKV